MRRAVGFVAEGSQLVRLIVGAHRNDAGQSSAERGGRVGCGSAFVPGRGDNQHALGVRVLNRRLGNVKGLFLTHFVRGFALLENPNYSDAQYAIDYLGSNP